MNILKKYIQNKCSKEEVAEVIKNLKQEYISMEYKENLKQYWNSTKDTKSKEDEKFSHILDRIHHQINISTEENNGKTKKIWNWTLRVAASLTIPLIAYIGYTELNKKNSYLSNPEICTLSVPIGAHSNIILPDGTQVCINSGSTLKYPTSFQNNDTREISLSGEAFFKVTKDSIHPFIVNTNKMDIKVLGTSFNIRNYKEEKNATVALVEGKVSVGSLNDNRFNESIRIKPNEIATIDKINHSITSTHVNSMDKYVAWQNGKLVFDNDPLADVINKLEKRYSVKIKTLDDGIRNYRITGTFREESVDRIIKAICISSSLSYKVDYREMANENTEQIIYLTKQK